MLYDALATSHHRWIEVKYAWAKFSKDPGPTLLPVILGSILQGVALTILWVIMVALIIAALVSTSAGAGASIAGFIGFLILFGLTFVMLQIVYAGWAKAGLDVASGRRPSLNELYRGWDWKQVATLAIGLSVVSVLPAMILNLTPGIGVLLAIAWMLGVWVISQFSVIYVIDQGLSATDAVRASYDLVRAHLQPVAVFDGLVIVAMAVGTLAFGIGTWIAVPVIVIAYGFLYRTLRGESVAP